MSSNSTSELSSYLQQSENDLIKWNMWDDGVLEKAKQEDKPILLSIGYCGCNWCDKMHTDSYSNSELAQIINNNFIPILLDKNERPDIDSYFQEVYIKLNNKKGGWPLTIFLTPNLEPFYATTNLPSLVQNGLSSFKELLNNTILSYNKSKESLRLKGREVLKQLKPNLKIHATKLDLQLIDTIKEQLNNIYDKKSGGFGESLKYLRVSTLDLILNLYLLTKEQNLLRTLEHTVNSMLIGGIFDHIEGGFFRYGTNNSWLIPHFNKTLHDNALMVNFLIKYYHISKNDTYKEITFKAIDFVINNLSHNKLFISSINNASDNGHYYTFSYNEAKELFEKVEIDTKLLYEIGISKNGNFNGNSVVNLENLEILEKKEIKKAFSSLKQLRNNKSQLIADKMIVTSYNCMIIIAILNASEIKKEYLDIALESLNTLEENMFINQELYHSTFDGKTPQIKACLEDYTWFIHAYIEAYKVTLEEIFIIKATNLLNEAIKRFYRDGKWLISNREFKAFASDEDIDYPSSVALMVQNILDITTLNEKIYEKFAFQTLQVHSFNLMRQPIARASLANNAIRYIYKDTVIKSNRENLFKLKSKIIDYPYCLLKISNHEEIELFKFNKPLKPITKTEEVEEILKQITNQTID